MWILAIITFFLALCRAHHGIGRFINPYPERLHGLLEKFKQNPPKCRDQEMICEDPEFEYPGELIELILDDYEKAHEQDTKHYQPFFDKNARYKKWMYETKLDYQACNIEYEEIYFPKVAFARNEPVFIVQREPYIIKKIAVIKCLGSKDGTTQCREHYDMKSMLVLDKNGTMELDLVTLPFGCDVINPEETTSTTFSPDLE